ncbi:cysteine-rich venom protein tigrin-like [Nelusetta ayraudi]|uniref:cysteine-rich venom protein tigrin-like n=1 Tax=Nelusetta ayraudi TaxID=303726 RepID=UPI003F6F6835
MLEMRWNDEAAANAQSWADGCSLKHSHSAQRRISTSGCGENLYMASGKNSWSSAIQMWYDEVKDFKYGVGSFNGGVVGHYTQVVWYKSFQVGCAMAYCPDAKYKYFYVCQYCPPGNYGLKKPYTSGDTCSDCPNDCNDKLCTNPCPYNDMYSNCPQLTEKGCTDWSRPICPASCKCLTEIK